MIRPILQLPDPVLRKVSTPVQKIDAEIKKLIEDMFETMYDAPGVGLAAVQIGVTKRVVTIDATRGDDEKKPMVFINPEIISASDEKDAKEEGCLSIAEFYEEVERPSEVKVRYMDEKGKTHEIEADGLLARALQHEIDHLNGVLFIDHISKLKRDRVTKKFTKVAKASKRAAIAG
ncbi:MAG: peptide deformylase [Xanthobacteraceae bacterium]|nr:peptide deformylase [Xanthobacteraceae bacterium]